MSKKFSTVYKGVVVLALGAMASMTAMAARTAGRTEPTPPHIELQSAHAFAPTLDRISKTLEGAGMTIFARIDHQAAAQKAGLSMDPATVLIYGNPKGGTPLMQAAPNLALDLPLRVLVRADAQGKTFVVLHPAHTLTRSVGLPDDKALPLARSEALIRQAVAP